MAEPADTREVGAELGEGDRVVVRLWADPDLPAEFAAQLSDELPDLLRRRMSAGVCWEVKRVVAALDADEQLTVTALTRTLSVDADAGDSDIGIIITDLPRRSGVRPVAAEIAPDERLALVSVPALGPIRLYRRTRDVVLRLIEELVRNEGRPSGERMVGSRWLGGARLVGGMLRANRPWRLFLGLSRSLAGVFATAAFAIINLTAWTIGVSLTWWRQVALAVSAVLMLVAWLAVDHQLWERGTDEASRRRARLYNVSTLITLTIGVVSLYAVLFVALFFVQQLLLQPDLIRSKLMITPGWAQDFWIVWFVTSAGVIGGALGSGFEDDAVVRRAAYGARQRERLQRAHDNDRRPQQ